MASFLERAASWLQVGDTQFRTVPLYESMVWAGDVDLDDYLCCGAPNGGPLALARDPTKVVAFRLTGPGAADAVSIYSPAGVLLGRAESSPGRLVGMRWTPCEKLMCVHETGVVDVCVMGVWEGGLESCALV